MLVELDVFSGRPNPRWELAEADAELLRAAVQRLGVAAAAPPEQPGLGYRGFIFTDETGASRAFRDYVLTPQAVLADPSSSVERFLRDRLPPELEGLRARIVGGG